MFTGIIQDIGEIVALDKKGDWTLSVNTEKLPLERLALGASVSCNGICLTVIAKNAQQFTMQISAETLSKTSAIHWQIGQRINLESALCAGDELGGHIVSGHVDGIARVVERASDGDSIRFTFEVPSAFAKYLAPKGSVTVDGVSLTVNDVKGGCFDVNIIPFTQQMTTLGSLKVGDEANFEIDMIARYVERMLNTKAAG